MENGRNKLCTTMFFLIPKNILSERPIALVPTLIRWWEALRAPEVAKWQQKYRVDWDATDGRNGGAQGTVWEILMEMERFKCRAGRKMWEQWPSCWAWRRHSSGQSSCCLGFGRVPCGYFEHPRRVQFEGCVAEPLRTVTAILSGSKCCLLLSCCKTH